MFIRTLCVSELRRNLSLPMRIIAGLGEIFIARTGEQGARQLVWAALGPDGKDGEHVKYMRGVYISATAMREPSDFLLSKEGYEMQERVWVSVDIYMHRMRMRSR